MSPPLTRATTFGPPLSPTASHQPQRHHPKGGLKQKKVYQRRTEETLVGCWSTVSISHQAGRSIQPTASSSLYLMPLACFSPQKWLYRAFPTHHWQGIQLARKYNRSSSFHWFNYLSKLWWAMTCLIGWIKGALMRKRNLTVSAVFCL